MNRVTEDIIIGWSIVLAVPFLLILGAIAGIWLLFFSPFIVGGLITYAIVRHKRRAKQKGVQPKRTPVDPNRIRRSQMIGAMAIAVVMTPIILFLLIFVIPPFWTLALVVIAVISKKRK